MQSANQEAGGLSITSGPHLSGKNNSGGFHHVTEFLKDDGLYIKGHNST